MSSVKPNTVVNFAADKARVENYAREKGMKDVYVEVFYSINKGNKKKLSGFLWNNPQLKVKTKESEGAIQVFYEGKKKTGCYCKVYQMKNGSSKFYRDGYTDITGTFRYALADLDGVSKFAILIVTENGGLTQTVNPPSQQNFMA